MLCEGIIYIATWKVFHCVHACIATVHISPINPQCQPEQPEPISTENTEYGGVLSSMHIAEESQVVESQLLPTSGYGEENVSTCTFTELTCGL